jgi:DNA-binding MarR family transcriptional regulator
VQGSRTGGGQPSLKGRAWRAFLEVHGEAVRVLDRELKRGIDLDLLFYDVMLHISEGSDGRRMSDLAQAVVLSKSGFTSVVDRMERAGLIERRPDPEDRRATRVVLTPAGARRFDEAAEVHRDIVHGIFTSVITDEEARAIVEALERVRRRLRE